MALINCPECGAQISDQAEDCPDCGHPIRPAPERRRRVRGFEWKSAASVGGWPLVHVAFGRNKKTGRLMAARGIIAIGQFAFGFITIAQFGVGLIFGLGQFVIAPVCIAQVAVGLIFGFGQLATGHTAVGQIAVGHYVRAQIGFGRYLWTSRVQDPEAVRYFGAIWDFIKGLAGG